MYSIESWRCLLALPGWIERNAQRIRAAPLIFGREICRGDFMAIDFDANVPSAEGSLLGEIGVHEGQIGCTRVFSSVKRANAQLRGLAGHELHLAGFLQDSIARRKRHGAGRGAKARAETTKAAPSERESRDSRQEDSTGAGWTGKGGKSAR